MTTIIGASRSPTPYRIKTPKDQHVRCGADILLNAVGRDLDGEGRCIVCGRPTRISIVRGRVSEVEPAEAVLHVVETRSPSGRVEIECEASPLFDRRECLRTWLRTYEGRPGEIFTPEEYMPRASDLVAQRVRPARTETGTQPRAGSVRVMRCADCDCSPVECAQSKSGLDCPSCRLESCCCWTGPSPIC